MSHAVAAQDVRQGALVLEQAVPYLPRAVHLAVVDPGVGSGRGMVAVQAGGQALVGPDNGLLVWAAEALGGVERAHALANPAYRLDPVSRTFHGRDVFAPAAAHLAAGVDPAELGPEVDPAGLVRLERAAPQVGAGRVGGSVVAIDHFGNLALDLRRRDLERAGRRRPGRGAGRRPRPPGGAGRDVRVGPGRRPAAARGLAGSLAVAVNRGRAADRLGAGPGDPVEVVTVPRRWLMGRRVLVTGAARSTGRRLVGALVEQPEVELVVAVDEQEPAGAVPRQGGAPGRRPAARRWSGPSGRPGSTPARTWG